jgi:hypothetical protein
MQAERSSSALHRRSAPTTSTHLKLDLHPLLEKVPHEPWQRSLVLGDKVVGIGADQLGNILTVQQICAMAQPLVDTQGEKVAQLLEIALRQCSIG